MDSFSAATLATCRDAAAQLAHYAATGDSHRSPVVFLLQKNAVKPGGVEQAFLDEVHRLQREEIGFGFANEAGILDRGREIGRRGQSEYMTSNRSGAGDNQVVNGDGICDSERRGVFLVEDVRSKLQCNRQNASSSFREHAQVVEAEMLWDLIALVDREHSLSSATMQASSNETVEATESPLALGGKDVDVSGPSLLGADAVWSRLQEAAVSQDECVSPPCGHVSTTAW